jgi:hypothetical protein
LEALLTPGENKMYDAVHALPCLNCEAEPVLTEVKPDGWRLICPRCKNKTRFYAEANDAIDAWNGGPEHRLEMERLSALP